MSTAVEITVSLKDSKTNPPSLKLKDSVGDTRNDDKLTTGVDAGAIVTWIPDYTSGISQLTSITKNTKITKNNYDLLVGKGIGQSNGNIVGTIVTESPGKGKIENYLIGFKIDGDDNTYYSDPKLSINN